MILFAIKFILTNILFSLAAGLVLVRINSSRGESPKYFNLKLLFYSLGIGPVFSVLLLYFLFLLLPGFSHYFYLAAVLAVYLILFIWGRKSVPILLGEIKGALLSAFGAFKEYSLSGKGKSLLYSLSVLSLPVLFLVVYFNNTLHIPIEGHDILIYGNIGKMYYEEKAVSYSHTIHDKKSGFVFEGTPKPAVSLLLTWEMILNRVFTGKETWKPREMYSDMYFRSISVYYGLLLLFLFFFLLRPVNKYLALLGIVFLTTGLRFMITMLEHHLDTYRMFFLFVSWIFLADGIKRWTLPNIASGISKSGETNSAFWSIRENYHLFLLGIFSGFAGFTHLIGFAAAVLNCSAFFLFSQIPFKRRAVKTLFLFLVMLLFGGIHYLLDIAWGARSGLSAYWTS